jgi:uncharacterized protein
VIGTLDDSEIDRLLRSETIGRLACCADGQPYVVPVMYAFADGCIYGHSHVGRKIEIMRANPSVCFEVDRVVNLTNWKSVIAWGRYEELHDEDAVAGMERLLVRFGSLVVGSSSVPWHGLSAPLVNLAHLAVAHGIVYRIRLTERTGRFERVP